MSRSEGGSPSTGHSRISNPEQYWHDRRVVSSILGYLGGIGTSWDDIGTISNEYLAVSDREKQLSSKSPLSTIPPAELEARISKVGGWLELHSSFLQKESEQHAGFPRRVILGWDLDYFRIMRDGNYDEATPIRNPSMTFSTLEGPYRAFGRSLDDLGVPNISYMSGKGYHFMAQASDPAVIGKIQQVAGPIEDSVKGKLESAPQISKSPKPVPLYNETAYKGAGRLQQWVNNQAMRRLRRSTPNNVEIWDKGFPGAAVEGVEADNTSTLFTVNNKATSTLGSPYLTKGWRSGLSMNRMVVQLPAKGRDYDYSWEDMMGPRLNLEEAAGIMGDVDCRIPEASLAIDALINLYMSSGLRKLHEAMDRSMGDSPEEFDIGYRHNNYEAIISKTKQPEEVRWMIDYANPVLVQLRYYVDKLIFQVFEAMGGSKDNLDPAPHVAGLLRSIYEDPRFRWGERWLRHDDAHRFARGSVEQALGQLFENDYP